jgi:transcriptional regulator with XRE-family HTH domain
MTLGKRIKQARERLEPKPRQQDIADKLGITDKAVSSWERDQTVPEPDRLPELRRLLRVTYSWLLEGRGPPPAPDDPEVLFDDLLEAERAAVRAMIAAFLKQRSDAA